MRVKQQEMEPEEDWNRTEGKSTERIRNVTTAPSMTLCSSTLCHSYCLLAMHCTQPKHRNNVPETDQSPLVSINESTGSPTHGLSPGEIRMESSSNLQAQGVVCTSLWLRAEKHRCMREPSWRERERENLPCSELNCQEDSTSFEEEEEKGGGREQENEENAREWNSWIFFLHLRGRCTQINEGTRKSMMHNGISERNM